MWRILLVLKSGIWDLKSRGLAGFAIGDFADIWSVEFDAFSFLRL